MSPRGNGGPVMACFGFHDVTDDPTASGFQRRSARAYKLPRDAFARHLDALGGSGLVPELVGGIDLTGAGRHLLLTFDDGGRSAVDAGAMLAERGWRGHFFVTTERIGDPRFVSAEDVRRLRRQGHVVGSHSHTHTTPFRALPPGRMQAEGWESCDRLAQILGEPCTSASVPGGDISEVVLHSAASAGIRHLFTSEPCCLPARVGGCWVLGRYMPKVGTSPARVRALAELRGWGRARLARRLKLLARTMLPLPYRVCLHWRSRETPRPG